jgi:hypothetical protein
MVPDTLPQFVQFLWRYRKKKMQLVKVYLDPTSNASVKLVAFATQHVQDLILRGKKKIKFVIASKKIKRMLSENDVEKLPAAKLDGDWFMGASSIQRELLKSIKNSQLAEPEDVDTMLNKYQQSQMFLPKDQNGQFVKPENFERQEENVDLAKLHREEMESRGILDKEEGNDNGGVNLAPSERGNATSYLDIDMEGSRQQQQQYTRQEVAPTGTDVKSQMDADIISGMAARVRDKDDALLLSGLLGKAGVDGGM